MINSDLDDLESVYSEQDNNRKLATIENNINELLLLTDDIDNTTLLKSCINPILICTIIFTIILVVLIIVIFSK